VVQDVRRPTCSRSIRCGASPDVYAAAIPEFPFKAGVHVNYQETKLRIRDGLPKMKDMPKELGGSGITLAE
jgi:hypothetical protein